MPELTLEQALKNIEALEDYVLLLATVYDFEVDGEVPEPMKDAIKADYVKTRLCHLTDSIKMKREIQNAGTERLAEDTQIN